MKDDRVTWHSPKGRRIKVSSLWISWMESHGTRGVDIAAYSSDGLHIWPCGEVFFEGRNGDKDDGVKFCECETCEKVRASIDGIPELDEAFLKNPWE